MRVAQVEEVLDNTRGDIQGYGYFINMWSVQTNQWVMTEEPSVIYKSKNL